MVAKNIARQLVIPLAAIGIVYSLLLQASLSWALPLQTNNNKSAIELIDSAIGQQIPMADDRFRIDYAVDEVTFIFFRMPDSAPVVVILPDGTKWYASRHPSEKVSWHSGNDYDLIKVREPVPGPWQVSGRIRPESRVMVVSNIEFHPESLPPLVFVGERLKLAGKLTQDSEIIEQRDFRNVFSLQLFFQSTNNPQYDNFGQPPMLVGEFFDDGRLMDEVPRDGIFTGQFKLDMTAGEYVPRYHVKTPIHERVFEAEPILVRRAPVQLQVTLATAESEPHALVFNVDDEFIHADDIVISGRIDYPNGEHQIIAISTAQGDSLHLPIPNYTFGVFEINSSLSTTDINGREFLADIAKYEFRAQRLHTPEPSQVETAVLAAQEQEQQHTNELAAVLEERQQTQHRIVWVVVANLAIVGLWGLFMLLRSNQTSKPKRPKQKKKTEQA